MGTGCNLVVSLASFVLSPLLLAQQQPKGQYKLEGTVVNSATGKPLPRALVQTGARAELTGPEGEFSFDGFNAGSEARVRASKPGYFTPGIKISGWSPDTSVAVGPGTGRVVLKLEPEAVITGRVTGEDDDPLEGVVVQALTYVSLNDGPRQLQAIQGGVNSDEDGNFRIAGLPAGRYYIAARAAINRRVLGVQARKRSQAYPLLVYYPGSPDFAAAGAVTIAPGQHMETPFSLALMRAYRVSGVVVASSDWKRIGMPMIVDTAGQVLLTPDSFDARSGAFDFSSLPSGTYTLRLSGTDAQEHSQWRDNKVVVVQDISDMRLVLKPGVGVPVVFRSEFSKPRTSGSCSHSTHDGTIEKSGCSDYPPARIELMSVDSPMQRFATEFGPAANPGATVIQGISPGKYLVRAQGMFGYVQSVRSGSVDLLREELVVPESGEVLPIEVVVRDDAATLSIKLHPERLGQKAVILVLADGALMVSPNLKSTTSSEVHFGMVPPGSYKVFAFDVDDYVDPDPAVLAKYSARSVQVTVSANSESNITVDVIHAEE
jgi:hypothetical protein